MRRVRGSGLWGWLAVQMAQMGPSCLLKINLHHSPWTAYCRLAPYCSVLYVQAWPSLCRPRYRQIDLVQDKFNQPIARECGPTLSFGLTALDSMVVNSLSWRRSTSKNWHGPVSAITLPTWSHVDVTGARAQLLHSCLRQSPNFESSSIPILRAMLLYRASRCSLS